MKLVTFKIKEKLALGVVVDSLVIDLSVSAKTWNILPNMKLFKEGFSDMLSFLGVGEINIALAERLLNEYQKRKDTITPPLAYKLEEVKLCAPIMKPPKIICIGLNYLDHAKEQNVVPPEEPLMFAKFPTAVIGPNEYIVKPKLTEKMDFEAELAVVIGKKGRNIPEEKAFGHIAGYTIMNDVSARDLQFKDKQWTRAKGFDSFAPMGPWIVTKDEIKNPNELDIKLWLNGELMQNSNTKNMIFNVPKLVSYISQVCTLEPGDIISTGTPSGVGVFRKLPIFLKPSDSIRIEIESIGILENKVIG